MRVALIFRGLCNTTCLDSKDLTRYKVCYADTFVSMKKHLFDTNPNVRFDVYGHGWITEDIEGKTDSEIAILYSQPSNVRCVRVEGMCQRDFESEYGGVCEYEKVLKDVYQYRQSEERESFDYDDVRLRSFFQNQYSYAYSISKASELVRDDERYDLYISCRWDARLAKSVLLDRMLKGMQAEDVVYINDQAGHSPVFVGDFVAVSSRNLWKGFYRFVRRVYEEPETHDRTGLTQWSAIHRTHICNNPELDMNPRVSSFSNQSLYAFYLDTIGYPYRRLRHTIRSALTKKRAMSSDDASESESSRGERRKQVHMFKPVVIGNVVCCTVLINGERYVMQNAYMRDNKPYEALSDRVEGFVALLAPHVILTECELVVHHIPVCEDFLRNLDKMAAFYGEKLGRTFEYSIVCDRRATAASDEAGRSQKKTVCCFSGGVDSFSTIYDHMDSIDTFFYGVNYDVYTNQRRLLEDQLNTIHEVAAKYNKDVIIANSNFKGMLHNARFGYLEGFNMKHDKWLLTHVPCKVCNFYNLCDDYGTLLISSWNQYDSVHMNTHMCMDSNKVVDELYSASGLRVVHDGDYRRHEKIERSIAADKDTYFKYLKVCWKNPNEAYNCSRCEKCVLTMVFVGLLNPKYLEELQTFELHGRSFNDLFESFVSKQYSDFHYNLYKRDMLEIAQRIVDNEDSNASDGSDESVICIKCPESASCSLPMDAYVGNV